MLPRTVVTVFNVFETRKEANMVIFAATQFEDPPFENEDDPRDDHALGGEHWNANNNIALYCDELTDEEFQEEELEEDPIDELEFDPQENPIEDDEAAQVEKPKDYVVENDELATEFAKNQSKNQ